MEQAVLRHELKYYLSRPGAQMIKSRLQVLMHPDPHTDGFAPYFIRSLYFDDMDCSAYRDKLSGVAERNKYRLRFYNRDLSYVCFEKKQKLGDRIRKTSVRMGENAWLPMLRGRCVEKAHHALLKEYNALVKSVRLQPLVLVDYHRTVFRYSVGNVRITLDEGIGSRRFTGDLQEYSSVVPVLHPDEVVLEVKYDAFLPPQIQALLGDIPKARSAVSKYCLCCSVL